MSDTIARGQGSNGLAWEIQEWTVGRVTLEIVDANNRNASEALITLTPQQAQALADALTLAAREVKK